MGEMVKLDISKKAHAYTPGLKIKRNFIVKKLRKLPIKGNILVNKGDKVEFNTIVARTEVPGNPHIVHVCTEIGVEQEDVEVYMVKKVNDPIKKGELLAKRTFLFGLFKSYCYSPVDGVVEQISDISGTCIIRELPIKVELSSYIPGIVKNVFPKEGVEIETNAAIIQGIFGVGGESYGEIDMLVKSYDEVLVPDMINAKHKGRIIVGGSFLPIESFKKAADVGVAGVIIGGMDQKNLITCLGYEIGIAITGQEKVPFILILTEGFGKINMSKRTFNLLKDYQGYKCAINGTTQIRAGVLRPEIIIPHESSDFKDSEILELSEGIKEGTPVRIIREPYFGSIGNVKSLPVKPIKIETGSFVRVAEIILENSEVVVVPRANIEIIET